MTSWREIEKELEEWARREIKEDPLCYLERNTNSSEVALGNIQLVTICDVDDPRGIRKLDLTSLAHRLARALEPASLSAARSTAPQASGVCPQCGLSNTVRNPARCLDCGFTP